MVSFLESSLFNSIIHGLKLLAVVVVADATFGMYKNFCQSRLATTLCVITAVVLLLMPGIWPQILVLLFAAFIGSQYLLPKEPKAIQSTNKISVMPLIIFVALLVGLPLASSLSQGIEVFGLFYQAGSLVFGGGHVVLPLLQNGIGDQLSQDAFLTGYAAAQAVPGSDVYPSNLSGLRANAFRAYYWCSTGDYRGLPSRLFTAAWCVKELADFSKQA